MTGCQCGARIAGRLLHRFERLSPCREFVTGDADRLVELLSAALGNLEARTNVGSLRFEGVDLALNPFALALQHRSGTLQSFELGALLLGHEIALEALLLLRLESRRRRLKG